MNTKPSSNKVNVDRLCALLGVDSFPDWDERLMQCDTGTYGYALDEALREGKSQEEAEQIAMKVEGDEREEAYNKRYDAVLAVAEDVFGKHGLNLVPVKGHETDRPWEYRIVPQESWKDALTRIRITINGVGMFEFANDKEFCESIPCTVRECVLTHLHWIKDWYEVYEGGKASSRIERRMR
jgi:hypothetical protein